MKPLNQPAILKKSIQFWAIFLLLLISTVLPAYCFIQTAIEQVNATKAIREEHQRTEDKRNQLYADFNLLYSAIRQSGSSKYQEQKIIEIINNINQRIGVDSPVLFSGYIHINRNIADMMDLIEQNVRDDARLSMLKRQLLDFSNVYKPSRNH